MNMDHPKPLKKAKQTMAEFRTFALRGNVIDMAVGVIIGGAFSKIISSLVSDVVMPILGTFTGKINFSDLTVKIGSGVVTYGVFLENILNFILIALCIFFAVKLIGKLRRKENEQPAEPPKPTEEVLLLRDIRDVLKNQPKN